MHDTIVLAVLPGRRYEGWVLRAEFVPGSEGGVRRRHPFAKFWVLVSTGSGQSADAGRWDETAWQRGIVVNDDIRSERCVVDVESVHFVLKEFILVKPSLGRCN